MFRSPSLSRHNCRLRKIRFLRWIFRTRGSFPPPSRHEKVASVLMAELFGGNVAVGYGDTGSHHSPSPASPQSLLQPHASPVKRVVIVIIAMTTFMVVVGQGGADDPPAADAGGGAVIEPRTRSVIVALMTDATPEEGLGKATSRPRLPSSSAEKIADGIALGSSSDLMVTRLTPPRSEVDLPTTLGVVSRTAKWYATLCDAEGAAEPSARLNLAAIRSAVANDTLDPYPVQHIRRYLDDLVAWLAVVNGENNHQPAPLSSFVGHCLSRIMEPLRHDAAAAAADRHHGGSRKNVVDTSVDAGAVPAWTPVSQRKYRIFFDLGSRALDQTNGFLSRYPEASTFDIFCIEANPSFNKLYTDFQRNHPRVNHLNAAAGTQSGVMSLSHAGVGSRVIDAPKAAAGQPPSKGVAEGQRTDVPVIGFADFLVRTVADVVARAEKGVGGVKHDVRGDDDLRRHLHVIVKMDVEKFEYAILHQLVRTGALTLVSELLLECHYNTNLAKSLRNASMHIGKDDCEELVQSLRRASGYVMDVVLWNNVKTARRSNPTYIASHGGFFPT